MEVQMKRSIQIFIIGALACTIWCVPLSALLTTLSSAQVPQMINYQGKLTTNTGAPVNDTLPMVFSIYSDTGGTNLLWTETQPAVVVDKGVFNVLLGSVSSISYSVFEGSIRYLGVKVGDDPEITPRKPMLSVAYAVTDGDWTINENNVYRSQGNVGIGTSSPGTKLEVAGDATISGNNLFLADLTQVYTKTVTLADDEYYDFPDQYEGLFWINRNGNPTCGALAVAARSSPVYFIYSGTGTETWINSDTDGHHCLIDNTSNIRLKNRIGFTMSYHVYLLARK
jgi:hypothetical protein